MIKGYITKEKLYKLVDEKLAELGITEEDYPLDARAIAESIGPSLKVEYHKFPTNKMGGILYKGEAVSSMALNTLRSEKGQNFDCMHELFHYWFHPAGTMLCVDNNYIRQNSGIEWQANEGAAQALMRQKLFIKKYKEFKGDVSSLSDFFNVGELSIDFRINNLRQSGFLPKKIEKRDAWLYKNEQWSPRIIYSKNAGFRIPAKKIKSCPYCDNIDVSNNSYCKICGNLFNDLIAGTHGILYSEGVPLDGDSRSTICPMCENEHIQPEDSRCRLCGINLHQQCTNTNCTCTPDSNARYCPECGSETTFYASGALLEWYLE